MDDRNRRDGVRGSPAEHDDRPGGFERAVARADRYDESVWQDFADRDFARHGDWGHRPRQSLPGGYVERTPDVRQAPVETGRPAQGPGAFTAGAAARDPQRPRGPRNYRRSDERLQELIAERLIDDPRIDASDVEVRVRSGEVVLEGTVEDRGTKYAIEELVDSIHGVRDVDNRLKPRRGLLAGLFGGDDTRDGWTTAGSASREGPATDQSGGSQGGTRQYGRPT